VYPPTLTHWPAAGHETLAGWKLLGPGTTHGSASADGVGEAAAPSVATMPTTVTESAPTITLAAALLHFHRPLPQSGIRRPPLSIDACGNIDPDDPAHISRRSWTHP
jgi:hypothetical protein